MHKYITKAIKQLTLKDYCFERCYSTALKTCLLSSGLRANLPRHFCSSADYCFVCHSQWQMIAYMDCVSALIFCFANFIFDE